MRGMRKGKENSLTQEKKKKGTDESGEGTRASWRSTTNRQGHDGSRAPGQWEIPLNIYRELITSPGPGERCRPTRTPLSPLPFPPQVSFPRSFGASRLHDGWRRPTSFPGRLTVCLWMEGDRV